MESAVLSRLKLARYDASTERHVYSTPMMVLFSVAGAIATGALAQIKLPYSPVPVTGEVLAVLMCGALLGSGYGLLSQALFIAAALAGVPWLAKGEVGMAVLQAPSIGYLLGFMAAAFYVGLGTQSGVRARTLTGQIVLTLCGAAIILLSGATYLMCAMHWTPLEAISRGVLPYVPIDIVKAVMAAMVTSAVLPKKS